MQRMLLAHLVAKQIQKFNVRQTSLIPVLPTLLLHHFVNKSLTRMISSNSSFNSILSRSYDSYLLARASCDFIDSIKLVLLIQYISFYHHHFISSKRNYDINEVLVEVSCLCMFTKPYVTLRNIISDKNFNVYQSAATGTQL